MAGEKILVIEDEPGIILTLEDRLKAEGYRVEVKTNGIDGETEVLRRTCQLVILDLMLPGRDGLAVCRRIRGAGVATPILMLTAKGTNHDVVLGLQLGADDYLTKPFDMQILLARVEALLRRSRPEQPITTEPLHFGKWKIDPTGTELWGPNGPHELNRLEWQLLRFFLEHPGRVVERDEILAQVWGYETGTTTRTLDVHVAKLRQKLGESDRPRHIHTIRGRGYLFRP